MLLFPHLLFHPCKLKCRSAGFSAGSFVGLSLLRLLDPLSHVSCEGKLGAIACPPALLFSISEDTANSVHLLDYAKDKLCVCDPYDSHLDASPFRFSLVRSDDNNLDHHFGKCERNYSHCLWLDLPI